MLSREATNTYFIVFGLTRPGLEPTIYRTRGEHANYYVTDAIVFFSDKAVWLYKYIMLNFTKFVGVCNCTGIWIGDDCSIDITVPPVVVDVGPVSPCDATRYNCYTVRIEGENFADTDDLTCHFEVLAVSFFLA